MRPCLRRLSGSSPNSHVAESEHGTRLSPMIPPVRYSTHLGIPPVRLTAAALPSFRAFIGLRVTCRGAEEFAAVQIWKFPTGCNLMSHPLLDIPPTTLDSIGVQ